MNDSKTRAKELLDALSHFEIYEDRKSQVFKNPITGEVFKLQEVADEAIETANALKKEKKDNLIDAKKTLLDIATGKASVQPKSLQIRNIERNIIRANTLTPTELKSFIDQLRRLESKAIVITQMDVKRASDKARIRQGVDLKQYIPSPEALPTQREIYIAPAPQQTATSQPISVQKPSGPSVGGALAGQAASLAGRKIVSKVLTGAAAKAVGVATGPAGWLAAEGLSFLKRHSKELLIGAGALVGGAGALIVGATPFLGAAIVGGLGYAAGGGIGGIGSGIASGASALIGGLVGAGSAIAGQVVAFFIAVLIGIPAVIALILFIINSGAYLVPPSSPLVGSGTIQSPFIEVQKTFRTDKGDGPFENSQLPINVTYTITVKATRGGLDNVSFQNTCNVVKDGTAPPCTHPLPEDQPTTISPTEPFTFSYSQTYNSPNFEDTFVNDTFTVTADSPEQKNAQSSGTAIVKIGNPPEECPSGWPVGSGVVTVGAYVSSFDTHKNTEAIDISTQTGSIVTARHSGTASVRDFGTQGYGKHVVIQSSCAGTKFISIYAHLSAREVDEGVFVTSGQKIGRSGSTGNSTGPHLHYEFRIGILGSSTGAHYPDTPPYMWTPYIPKNIPRGCRGGACGTSIP